MRTHNTLYTCCLKGGRGARIALICATLTICPAWGQQWLANGNTWYSPSGTSVGIGTSNAKGMFDVYGLGQIVYAPLATYTSARFSDAGQNAHSAILFDTGASTVRGFYIAKSSQDFAITRFDTNGYASPVFDLYVASNGHVGIGTSNPQNPLSVNGIIQAKEVLVNAAWSDYVFQPDYLLRPLTDVASFIKENHHLPGIPSEAEVEEKGISLGEMQSKLLAKVEELTLHMIRENERNNELEQRNRDLQQRITRLEQDITNHTAERR